MARRKVAGVGSGRSHDAGVDSRNIDHDCLHSSDREGVAVQINRGFILGNGDDIQHGCAAVAHLRHLDRLAARHSRERGHAPAPMWNHLPEDQAWIVKRSSTGDHAVNRNRLKIERLSLSHARLKESLLPLLRGNVFHMTTRAGFLGITKDGLIRNNKNGLFTYSFPQSNRSYARNRGWVSLFDLGTLSDDQVERALGNFYFLNPPHVENNPFFLFLTKSFHHKLVPWTHAGDEQTLQEMFIPIVEGFYPEDIPITCINRVVAVKVRQAKTMQSPLSNQIAEAVRTIYTRNLKPL